MSEAVVGSALVKLRSGGRLYSGNGLSTDIMRAAMRQAHEGRMHILGEMAKVLPGPRPTISPYAPQHKEIFVNPDIIRLMPLPSSPFSSFSKAASSPTRPSRPPSSELFRYPMVRLARF